MATGLPNLICNLDAGGHCTRSKARAIQPGTHVSDVASLVLTLWCSDVDVSCEGQHA